ncbi:MAG: hypothetical protein P4L16_00790 [Chlamydiales bacterium]|nr:hypothetical protein [Chlamydiales bacterium]
MSILLAILTSCSPSSQEEFITEAESHSRMLVKELETIHTKEELLKKKASIRKGFTSLVHTAIQARKFQENHLSNSSNLELDNFEPFWGIRLKEELKRIYLLDGGRELIESYQKDALETLDLFEKTKKGD